MVKFALEMNRDWKVFLASDGIEGVTKAELERPDVILLDLVMPHLDGLTVCEVLKTNLITRSIPLIFMTAMTQDKIVARLENSLAEGIIFKPFNPLNLDSQIAIICQWRSSENVLV
ncbi:response regulator [Myxosarcina sp. GI1(2024)]